MDFLVKRDDLHECRIDDTSDVPNVEAGEALLRVDTFGFTSNNVTYGVFGDAMSYWDFFPADKGWGRIPVWGFADVLTTANSQVAEGTRVFGYLPMSRHFVVSPDRVDDRGFVDSSPHRSHLPPTYNAYRTVDADPNYDEQYEDQQMLLWPLFFTAFLLDDFLGDSDLFGAEAVVLSSASSKTASGTAFLLAERDGLEVIGLTSPRNVGFVEGLGCYDRVVTYDDVESLPDATAVYVDMAGDASVRSAVHHRYGDALAYSSMVGATHWDQGGAGDDLPGPDPSLFFAPDQARRRAGEWGQDGLDARFGEAWRRYCDASGQWLEVVHGTGPSAVEEVYLEVLDGRTDPSTGHVLSMWE